MKLLVVIANYKVAPLTIDCLHSIAREIGRVPGTHVTICENGSGDDSAARIQKAISDNSWESWCSLVAVNPNLGFTGGNNIILRSALKSVDPPKYALLLNADTIVHPGALRILVEFMDRYPKVGIAGSRLEYPDGTPQRSAFRFHSPLGEFESAIRLGLVTKLLSRWVVAPPLPPNASETDWVGGACMIVRCEVFRDVGILDEGYYTHYEDVDLCINARKADWQVWYIPESRVTHFVGMSTGLTVKEPKRFPSYYFESRRRYFLKNHGPVYAALADAGLIVGMALWQLRILFGKSSFSPPGFFSDSIKHSVFLTGFKLKNVQNPSLSGASSTRHATNQSTRTMIF